MSDTPVIPIAAAPIALAGLVIGAAAATIGLLARGTVDGCRQVYKTCKDGNYPIERMNVVSTCLTNISGLEKTLTAEGFKLTPLSSDLHASFKDISSADVSLATDGHGRDIFIVRADEGITFVSQKDLAYTTIRDFTTNEIVSALKETDFTVSVETKHGEKIVTATDTRKNQLTVKVGADNKGSVTAAMDSRKTKRPHCEKLHQLIEFELKEKKGGGGETRSRKKEDERVRVKR